MTSVASNTETAPAAAPVRREGWTGGRVTVLVVGSVVGLIAFGLLAGGGVGLWADRTQRDADGFVTMLDEPYATDTYVLTSDAVELRGGWLYPRGLLDRIKVGVSSETPIFVGVAPTERVREYLDGVARTTVVELDDPDYRSVEGGAPSTPPGEQTFWTASSTGRLRGEMVWRVSAGSWTVVVMNADGSRGVDVIAAMGARVPDLLWISVTLLAVGVLFALLATALMAGAIRRAGAISEGG